MPCQPTTRRLVEEALRELRQATLHEIRAHIDRGFSDEAVRGAIQRMHRHKAGKMVYIASWNRKHTVGGDHTPVWALGNKPDAPPLENMTKAQQAKLYRAKHRMRENVKVAARDGSPLATNPFAQLLRHVGVQYRIPRKQDHAR